MTAAAEERAQAVRDEARRVRELKAVVDLATSIIAQGRLPRAEALDLVTATRRRVLELFPDREETFELVLAPRFARLVAEHCRPAARVLPFPR